MNIASLVGWLAVCASQSLQASHHTRAHHPGQPHAAVSAAASSGSGHTAVWGFAGVVAGVLVTGGINYWIAKSTRRSTNQLAAIQEHQKAAIALRDKYRSWGKEVVHSPASTAELDTLVEAAEVSRDRVRKTEVHQTFDAWQDIAQYFWDGDDTHSLSDEEAAWNNLRTQWREGLRKYE